MEQVVLKAQKKDDSGKSVARKLRAEGLVPGVIYGLGKETVALAVQGRELYELLEKATGGNVLISLDMPTCRLTPTPRLIKEIQWSPVHKEALSVDCSGYRSRAGDVSVNIAIHGHATGLDEGGSMNHEPGPELPGAVVDPRQNASGRTSTRRRRAGIQCRRSRLHAARHAVNSLRRASSTWWPSAPSPTYRHDRRHRTWSSTG